MSRQTVLKYGIPVLFVTPLVLGIGVLVAVGFWIWSTFGPIVAPDSFPVDYTRIDSAVEEFDPASVGPVAMEGHSADEIGNSSLHHTVVWEGETVVDPLVARLSEAGYTSTDSEPLPDSYWNLSLDCGDGIWVHLFRLDRDDSISVGDDTYFAADSKAVVARFTTSAATPTC